MIKYIRAGLITGIFCLICYPFIWIFTWLKNIIPLSVRYFFGRLIIKSCNLGLGAKIKIKNKALLNLKGPVVFYGNHQSDYDILALISKAKKPLAAMAKIEVRKFPLVGNISYFINCTYLDRANLRQSARVIAQTAKYVEQGKRMVVFPEGTRTKDENKEIGEFKAGAFKVAQLSNATIIPFAIDGSYTVLSPKWPIRKTKIKISFLEAIEPSSYQDLSAQQLADKVKELIVAEYNNIRTIGKKI